MQNPFTDSYRDRVVLITGHTGFKGSWLAIWLRELGARVSGYSLDPPTDPSNFQACRLDGRVHDVRGDVRDLDRLRQTILRIKPEVVFHLAAQPIVLRSYREPKLTIDTNAGGTVNLLEAVRRSGSVRAVVCVTTDKVYEDEGWIWGYREIDRLGGHDPYSVSKAMAELAISSYRRCYFPPERFQEHRVSVASARAGNVIGGGDWAPYRLVPDCMRALLANEPIHLRNPHMVRPWQSVLESLSGYLWLGARLLGPDGQRYAEAWNLGPQSSHAVTTRELVEKVIGLWGGGRYETGSEQSEQETALLRLNWDKAANRLGWRTAYSWEEAVMETVGWFKRYQAQLSREPAVDMYGVCAEHIRAYTNRAREQGILWAGQ
jgi:CDP-glucose 4,6-dehydratase